jgi:hypothetical protein
MSKEGRNRRYSQRSVDASLKEKKKRKRTGKGRTGRQEEEERRYLELAKKQQDHLK